MSDAEISSGSVESTGVTSADGVDTSSTGADNGASDATPEVNQPVDLKSKLNKIHEEVKAKSASSKAQKAFPEPAKGEEVHKAVAPPASGEDPVPATEAQVAEAVEKAYEANYKFKFLGEEKEIPELLRGVIKDAESEKAVRELVEKSMGLDFIKPKYQQVNQELQQMNRGLEVLDQHIAKKDYNKFFQAFGIDDNTIFAYAKQRLEYMQMPEDQRAQVDANNERQERLYQLEQENAILAQQREEHATQVKHDQLSSLLEHPEVAPITASYPGGKKGFYQDVAQYAYVHELRTGEDLTPQQAIVAYVNQRGLRAQAQPQVAAPAPEQQAPTLPNATAAKPVTTAAQAPTLPKVPSQGTSPAKKVVSSMKDIMKKRDQLMAEYGSGS